MFKKTITYDDFDGNSVTEDLYFHLSKAELIEMELSEKEGLAHYLQNIIESEDGAAILETFKKIVLSSYGKKSEDGRRFIKSAELRDEFTQSNAYSELFMELATNAESAAEFINGLVPADMAKELAAGKSDNTVPEVQAAADDRITSVALTEKDIREIAHDELLAAYKEKLGEANS